MDGRSRRGLLLACTAAGGPPASARNRGDLGRRGLLWACAAAGLLALAGCGGSEPARIEIEAEVEALPAGESAQVRIQVLDNLNTPAPGQVVRLSTDTPGAVLSAEEVVTGPAGTAAVTLTASEQVGENRIEAVAGALSASFSVPGVPGPPARLEATADPQRTVSGGVVLLAVAVADRFGNPVPDVPVGLRAADDGAALSGGETDGAGSLTRAFTTAPEPGDNRVEVSAAGLQQVVVVPTRRLSRLTVRPERAEVAAGGVVTFEATGFDDDGGELGVRPQWTLAGDVGALDPAGTFTAGTVGRGRVRAAVGGVVASSALTVVTGPPSRIEVTPAAVRIESGEVMPLRAVVRDAGGNEVALDPAAPGGAVQWSLSRDVGDLDDQGVLTAGRVGEATAAAEAGGLRGEARVVVTAGPLTTIAVEPAAPTVVSGTERQFRAVGQDAGGNEVPLTAAWSLSDAIGELDDAGRFRAVRAGEARLVVASGRVAASTVIEVVPGPLTSIEVTPEQAEVRAGTAVDFKAVGRDAAGNEVALEPVWELSSSVGRLDAAGVLTGGQVGRAQVTARSGEVSGAADVRVVPGALTSLEVAPATATLVAGTPQQFVVTGVDVAGNRVTVDPAWRVSAGRGRIDADGTFVGTAVGAVTLAASVDDRSVEAAVQVTAGPLASIAVTPRVLHVASGSVQAFAATGRDALGNERPIAPAWTVTGGVGSIGRQDGRLAAVTAGAGSVVATVGALSGVAEVRVGPGPLAAIDLAEPGGVRVGEARPLVWTGADAAGNAVVVRPEWRVTGGVGRVDGDGRFVAAAPGTGRIVARSGEVSAEAPVRVLPGPLAELRVVRDPDRVEVTAGEPIRLSADGRDGDGHAVDVEPRWEVVRGAGSIDGAGRFVPTRAGPAVVRASSGSLTAETRVNVAPGPLAAIVVAPARADVPSDTTRAFTAAGRDAYGNLVDVDPQWSVTYGVGRLDADGRFTGTTVGAGVVSATAGGVVGTADVTTTPGRLSVLEVRPAAPEVRSGELLQLSTAGFDARGNTVTGYAVEWRVSGDVGTVEPARGIFTALAAGTGRVLAASDGVEGSAEVRVAPGDPSADASTVEVSPGAVAAGEGAAFEVTVTVRDAFRNPVPGAPVRVVSSRAADRIQPAEATTGADGAARLRVSSDAAGRSALRVTAGAVELASPPPIEFR